MMSPNQTLAKIGLPPQTTQLMSFKVVDEKSIPNSVILPYRLNQKKLDANDKDYAANLAEQFSLN